MAKAKKKEALSLEEKLKQALVPVDEQPYEVPDNWCWVKVGNLVDLHRGVSYKKNEGHSIKEENDCLVMRGGNILEGAIDVEADNIYVDKSLIKAEQYVRENDIIIVSSTGSTKVIGRAGISCADYEDVSFGAFLTLVRPKEEMCKRYVDYYFQSQIYRERIRSLASGVNINNIRAEYITNSPIPLPPLAEQKRIVEQIESLFAKLDEAKEKAEEVVKAFEKKKASILFKAFTGKLSQRWRDEHKTENHILLKKYEKDLVPAEDIPCEIPDSWCWVKMGALGYTNIGLTYKPSDVSDEGIIVLRSSNIQGGKMDYGDIVRVNMDVPENKMCKKGDLLICARNGSKALVGKTAIVDEDGMSYGAFMAIFRSEYNRYIYYFMSSPFFRNLIDSDVNTTTINQVTQALIKNLEFPLAPPNEQDFIVKQLDELIEKEIKIKETAIEVIDKIDLMKKSILAKAFRGELGTNNPDEESAVELLKSILGQEE